MKPVAEEKLCKDFADIFDQRGWAPSETAMCWGFECGDGWFDLIYKLCENITDYLKEHPDVPQVKAVQVKEKWGGLRFYVDGGDSHISELIAKAEDESFNICESCGSKDNVTTGTTRHSGWVRSICKTCLDAENKQ